MRTFLPLCAALLLTASLAPAAPILNGDFETGDFSGWTVAEIHGTANAAVEQFAVTEAGPSQAARFRAGRGGSPFGPAGGVFLSQVFSLDLSGVYGISASIAAHMPDRTPVFSNGHAGTFELLLNSDVLDKVVFGAIASGDLFRDELRYEGILSSGTYELGIRIRRDFAPGPGTPLQFVDDVRIANIVQPAPAIEMIESPEPGSLTLVAAGLAALLLGRRRLR